MFTSSSLGLVLLLVSFAFAIKKKDVLKLHFFSLRCVTPWFPEDWDLPDDAFISYSHDDKDFTEGTLLHQMENVIQPPYRCCIHIRDFNVGEVISDQIVAAVEQSRRTIIVLSAKYTTAMWTRLEFRAAHARAVRNRRQRLIIVLPPDTELPDRSDLDEDLRPYFDTALRADDPNFWPKLRLALPMRGSSQADVQRRGGELELVPGAREVVIETGHCPACSGQAG